MSRGRPPGPFSTPKRKLDSEGTPKGGETSEKWLPASLLFIATGVAFARRVCQLPARKVLGHFRTRSARRTARIGGRLNRRTDIVVCALAFLALLGCREATSIGEGIASFYADSFHGRKTANGETYSKRAYTAAHKTLAFDTRVKVTNLDNGRSVWVRINDRGPLVENRIIDLSGAAARKLQMTETGTAKVRLEVYD